MGGVGIFSEISYYEISFPQLKEIAKKVSEELYEKYKGMNFHLHMTGIFGNARTVTSDYF